MRETIITGAIFLDYKFTAMCSIFDKRLREKERHFSATERNKTDRNPLPAPF
jgi:hypothetical protein